MSDFKAKIDAMVVSASTGKAASSVPRSPVPPDTSIDRPENESITEMLMGEICESNYAKEQPLEDRESKLAEHHSSEPMFVQYAKASRNVQKRLLSSYAALRYYLRPGKRMRNLGQRAMRSAELLIPMKSKFALSWTLRKSCLLYTSPSPRDYAASRMPSSA